MELKFCQRIPYNYISNLFFQVFFTTVRNVIKMAVNGYFFKKSQNKMPSLKYKLILTLNSKPSFEQNPNCAPDQDISLRLQTAQAEPLSAGGKRTTRIL